MDQDTNEKSSHDTPQQPQQYPLPPPYPNTQAFHQPETYAYDQAPPSGNPPLQQPGHTGQHTHSYPPGPTGYYPVQAHITAPGQQQQQTMISGVPAPQVFITPPVYQSFVHHIVLSCVVFWICGWICGAIAFYLAIVAGQKSLRGDNVTATQFGKASLVVSIAGIVVGSIIIAVFVGISVTNQKSSSSSYYDTCYSSNGHYYTCSGK